MKPIRILLVEDDELDVIDIRRSLDKLKVLYQLSHVRNGEEAITFFMQIAWDSDEVPDVVLIDINMPKMNGLELLANIRENDQWKQLKCFIITTSDEKIDRTAAERLGVSGYIIKPLKLNSPASMDAFNLMIDLLNIKKG